MSGITEDSSEAIDQFILEEGPLSAGELLALPAASREDYLRGQRRRLERLGREGYCQWVRRHSGRGTQEEGPTLRPIDDQLLGIVLEYFEQRYHARALR